MYRFSSEIAPITPLKLKVEINTREFFSVLGHERRRFAVASPWFTGEADVLTYRLEELLGTKLRALYQRRKGRDLYDLDLALRLVATLDPALVVECCKRYLAHGETPVSRGEFENNLAAKLVDKLFTSDVPPLLVAGVGGTVATGGQRTFDVAGAHTGVSAAFIQRLPLPGVRRPR